MTRAVYVGHEPLTFTDYLDLGTGKTLHAKPGVTYDVAPASGRVVPDMPEPWFTAVASDDDDDDSEGAAAEGDAGEPAHDEDPETDTPREF